jgi:hypothetical protein
MNENPRINKATGNIMTCLAETIAVHNGTGETTVADYELLDFEAAPDMDVGNLLNETKRLHTCPAALALGRRGTELASLLMATLCGVVALITAIVIVILNMSAIVTVFIAVVVAGVWTSTAHCVGSDRQRAGSPRVRPPLYYMITRHY